MRVPQFLMDHRIAFETLVHPPAFTAQKRAKYLGVPGQQVAKSVLLVGPSGYVLAVLPATHHISTRVLSRQLDGAVRLADDYEMGEVFQDCEWGVAAPFGTLYNVPTILDESLVPADLIVFESHLHAVAIRMLCRDFERLERPRRLRFAFRTPEREQ